MLAKADVLVLVLGLSGDCDVESDKRLYRARLTPGFGSISGLCSSEAIDLGGSLVCNLRS